MDTRELICLNFAEVRRRSTKVWLGIPEDKYDWKPDADAMSCIAMVRHMIESQYIYQQIAIHHGDPGELITPWQDKPLMSIEQEIEYSKLYVSAFMDWINKLSDQDLDEIEVVRPALNQRRKLGDYLLRIAYHEAIHTGQLLSYLRTMNVDRPEIWD
ncbi:DinB family protein [Mucilaginibacter lappiensis]|uniref:Putative damage-inducible protein DinB n=1 Tax=Mucilaginibacter lappiensis TaxID=354630 RepID=A0A841JGD6_9SPHI|nr:DinB family protein [Mucilaginibacter lappiensis]MBB6128666.1 putative damage-inducible protein DinB [Mucilaginibacter lappiensis]